MGKCWRWVKCWRGDVEFGCRVGCRSILEDSSPLGT